MPELITCWETAAMPIRIEQGIPTAGLYGALIDDGNVLIRALQLHRNLTSMRGEAHAPQGSHAKKAWRRKTCQYCSLAHQCGGVLPCLITVVLSMSYFCKTPTYVSW